MGWINNYHLIEACVGPCTQMSHEPYEHEVRHIPTYLLHRASFKPHKNNFTGKGLPKFRAFVCAFAVGLPNLYLNSAEGY